MDGVSAAASVLAIAGAGIQVSLKLIAFADQVSTASKRIEDVGTDVSVTAATLQELGEFMNLPTKRSTTLFYPHQISSIASSSERCARVFDELRTMLGKASHQLRDRYNATSKARVTREKIKLSRLECMKWPFLQPSMDSLRSELRDAKATLTLMLQVVNLRYAQKTASLNQDELEDLKRTIIAMKRHQLATNYGTAGGVKEPPSSDSDVSISDTEITTPKVTLEAWSVKPNTWSGESPQHFVTTQLPLSQERIMKQLKQSPQSYDSLVSVWDGLSPLERDAISREVLATHGSSETHLRSMTSKSWSGSHALFGQVKSRKFSLIIERRTEPGRQPRSFARHSRHRSSSTSPEPPMEVPMYKMPMRHHKHRGSVKREGLYGHEERGSSVERRRMEELERLEMAYPESKQKGRAHVKERMEPVIIECCSVSAPVREVADDDLIKDLLAQYTDYDPGEPSTQSSDIEPPPAYKEANLFAKRESRPY